MKIIKPGIILPLRKFWWEDQDIRCKKCNTIFQIEKNDFRYFEPHRSFSSTEIFLNCPHCENRLCVSLPDSEKNEEKETSLFKEVFGEKGVFEKIFGKSNI